MIKQKTHLHILFSILVALWCIGIIAAPVMKHSNSLTGASAIYSFFSHVCHQEDSRSFHIEGEKLGVCIRCTSIYFGSLAGLILLPAVGALKRWKAPNKTTLLIAVLPILTDVIFNAFNFQASSIATRMISGVFFGAVVIWWIMPLFIEACLQLIKKKKNRSLNSGVCSYAREAQ
jgi:uncharacterized membrane protein